MIFDPILPYTVEPLKTATLRGMENWPSYGGGRLIEVIYLPTIECILSYFKLNMECDYLYRFEQF